MFKKFKNYWRGKLFKFLFGNIIILDLDKDGIKEDLKKEIIGLANLNIDIPILTEKEEEAWLNVTINSVIKIVRVAIMKKYGIDIGVLIKYNM